MRIISWLYDIRNTIEKEAQMRFIFILRSIENNEAYPLKRLDFAFIFSTFSREKSRLQSNFI